MQRILSHAKPCSWIPTNGIQSESPSVETRRLHKSMTPSSEDPMRSSENKKPPSTSWYSAKPPASETSESSNNVPKSVHAPDPPKRASNLQSSPHPAKSKTQVACANSVVLLHDSMPRPTSSILSTSQHRILDCVLRRELLRKPNFISDLVADLGLRNESSLTPTLKRMERLGVLEIQGGGTKGRQRLIVSTEKGRLLSQSKSFLLNKQRIKMQQFLLLLKRKLSKNQLRNLKLNNKTKLKLKQLMLHKLFKIIRNR